MRQLATVGPVSDPGARWLADEGFRARCQANLKSFPVAAAEGIAPGRRHSAVTLCIEAGPDGDACLVITQRAAGLRRHAGQYALPGGRVDPGEDAIGAALREAEEEVALVCTRDDVLGLLDDYVTRAGDIITPVVVWGPPGAALVPNPVEVAAVHLVPIAGFDHPEAPRLLVIPESDRPVIQMPVFGNWIHAPTAAVLYQFREVAVHGRITRVSQYEQPTWAWP
jgi:8-oxo-dGTP pyrophosphatase MutT (NUDIX family)